jgi:hypothetical protein
MVHDENDDYYDDNDDSAAEDAAQRSETHKSWRNHQKTASIQTRRTVREFLSLQEQALIRHVR